MALRDKRNLVIDPSKGRLLVHGVRYDFASVYEAYESIVDVLTAEVVGARSRVVMSNIASVEWPVVGKSFARDFWGEQRARFDIANIRLVHTIGAWRLEAYLLGTASARLDLGNCSLRVQRVFAPEEVILRIGRNPQFLVSEPEIRLYGRKAPLEHGEFCRIERALARSLHRWLTAYTREPSQQESEHARIGFPAKYYSDAIVTNRILCESIVCDAEERIYA